MQHGVSLFGLIVLTALAWITSVSRRRVSVRLVIAGLLTQLLIGLVVFHLPGIRSLFLWLNEVVLGLLGAARSGSYFLFGPLALGPGETGPAGDISIGVVFVAQVLPAVIFFAALTTLLYYWRVMQPVVYAFAKLFQRVLRLSGAESLCAASNVFVGIESVFTIRPFLSGLTRSEFLTMLTASMATVASTTLAIYVSFLRDVFPTIAGHLLSASLISIPAAVMVSKILLPEEGQPTTLGTLPIAALPTHSSSMDAVSDGAQEGLKLAGGIASLLIAVLGLVALVNLGLGTISGWLTLSIPLTVERLLGWAMLPFAWLLGVPMTELSACSQLLGERLIVTEVVAYRHLAELVSQGMIVSPRTVIIMSYALCGFAHVASMAIFVGGIGALVPDRRSDLTVLGVRALWGALLATLMTGCVAGVYATTGSVL